MQRHYASLFLFVFLMISISQLFAQESVVKTGFTFDDIHFTQLQDGRIVASGNEKKQGYSSWYYKPYAYLWDSLGGNLEVVPIENGTMQNGSNTVDGIIQLSDGKVVFGGRDDHFCLYCGTGYHPYSVVSGYLLDGSIQHEFTEAFNVDTTRFDVDIYGMLESGMGNLVFLTDDHLSLLSSSGDSISLTENLSDFQSGFAISSNSLILRNGLSVHKTDTFGNSLSFHSLPGCAFVSKVGNSQIAAGSGDAYVELLDTSLNLISSWDFSTSLDALMDISAGTTNIYFFGKQGNSYKLLWTDDSLNIIDSISFSSFQNVHFNQVFLYDSHFVAAGYELVQGMKQPVVKKYNYEVNGSYSYALDAGALSFSLDSLQVSNTYGPPPAPQDIKNLSYSVTARVKNFGDTPIDTLMVSCQANVDEHLTWGACYSPLVHRQFTGLNLMPNEEISLFLGYLKVREVIPPFEFQACAWTDIPNYRIDNDAFNNATCSDFIFTNVEETSPQQSLNFFPNPSADGIFQIETKEAVMVEIYNSLGSKLKTVEIQDELDLSDQPAGVYHAMILKDERVYFQKLIVQ
jgi:hypothetical protein